MSEQKSPAFQFYVKDWRSSTRVSRMSFKERGMYLELLIEQWDKGPLPLEPRAIAELIGASTNDFVKCWPTLKGCFHQTPDGWINDRLERERVKQQLRKQRASDFGRKNADLRWGTHSTPTAVPIPLEPKVPIPENKSGHSFSIAIAGASAIAGAGASDPPPTARSKRPIFSGARLVIFEWLFDDLCKLLGPHANAFHLDEWFYALDARCVTDDIIPPPRDKGAWVKQECLLEAQRRGVPLKIATVEGEADVYAEMSKRGPSVRG